MEMVAEVVCVEWVQFLGERGDVVDVSKVHILGEMGKVEGDKSGMRGRMPQVLKTTVDIAAAMREVPGLYRLEVLETYNAKTQSVRRLVVGATLHNGQAVVGSKQLPTAKG